MSSAIAARVVAKGGQGGTYVPGRQVTGGARTGLVKKKNAWLRGSSFTIFVMEVVSHVFISTVLPLAAVSGNQCLTSKFARSAYYACHPE